MELNRLQRGATHVCLPCKLLPRYTPIPQQPHNLCSPVATRHSISATHSGLQPQSTPSHSPQGCNRCSWHCQCHRDNAHHHSRHSSRHIKGLSCECFSHRVFLKAVACSRSSTYNHRFRAAAAPEDAQSAAHNDDHSRSEQARTPPSAPVATAISQPAQSTANGGDDGQGRDSGYGGGHGSGSGGDAGGFGDQPKFPVWYTVWVWCTALLYLVWRWQWRRDRRLAAEQFEQEQAAEEQLKQDWQNFAQQYKIQAGPAAATKAGNDGRR